jgi:hypothetical protein
LEDVIAKWSELEEKRQLEFLSKSVYGNDDVALKVWSESLGVDSTSDFNKLDQAAKDIFGLKFYGGEINEEEGEFSEEEGWVNFNKASSNIENVDKEETFGIGNMKQGHYVGRTYRNRKTISQEKEKGWKSLLRSYDPPVKDTTSENLNEIDVEGEAGPVVDQYFTYIMNYFNTHHDDIYDMNNFLTALKHVTTTVTSTRDEFAKKIGFYGTDDGRNDDKYKDFPNTRRTLPEGVTYK